MTGVILCINVMASPMVWTFQTETFVRKHLQTNLSDLSNSKAWGQQFLRYPESSELMILDI